MENPWLCYLCFRRLSSYRSAYRHMEECHHIEKDYVDGVDGVNGGRIMTLSDNLKEGNNVEEIAWGCFDPEKENYWGIIQEGVVIRERRRIGTHAAVQNANFALIDYRLRTNRDNYPDGKALGIGSGELAVIAQAALEIGESLEMGLKSLKRPQTEAQWIAKLAKQRVEYDSLLASGKARKQKRQQERKQEDSLVGKRRRLPNEDGRSMLPPSKAAKPQMTQSFGYQTNQPLGYRTSQPFGYHSNHPFGYGTTQTLDYGLTQPVGYNPAHYVDCESAQTFGNNNTHYVDCKFAQTVECRPSQSVDDKSTQIVDDNSTQDIDDKSTEDVDHKSIQDVDYKSTEGVDNQSAQPVNNESAHSIDTQSTLSIYPESPLAIDPQLYLPLEQLMAIPIYREPTSVIEPQPSEEEELAEL